ncbi:tRNA uracil 4-sulfurtransferase ThiI [Salinibius halmophilus]|uniref:tRNA uracil 4-sulfurtransferase ThiI n=1 Tax=Salinibius halmophilus TaxID=1853216 RepID=UPI000E66BE22|nr:tRNA uracil 4-sulfurtransferase ThiI [Salinibius halmophilus]
MNVLLKLSPEITIKTNSIRKLMIKHLRANVRNTLTRIDERVKVKGTWDSLTVLIDDSVSSEKRENMLQTLCRISGVQQVLSVTTHQFESFERTLELLMPATLPEIANKSFCVRVRRVGQHDFSSQDIERYLGGGLLKFANNARVQLKKPDVEVKLELVDDQLSIITERRLGLGGYPMGSQDQCMALMSGGYDSPVAAYRMMRRGVKTHYCFFNLGGPAHEKGVKEVTHYLWQQYSASHRVYFVSVPFEPVVNEILAKIPNGYMGVVLKRMMLRAAARIAQGANIPALVTGEAIAQVSSQTMQNLSVIDQVTEQLVLRPVATEDKQVIIDEAQKIGTAKFAEVMPEYCGVISKKPNTKVQLTDIVEAEANFDFSVLNRAIESAVRTRSDRLLDDNDIVEVAQVSTVGDNEVVIDIRHPTEVEAHPLLIEGVKVLNVPFYKLRTEAEHLDSNKQYLLYCDQGVMSRMQAVYLADQGYQNFSVFKK